LEATSETGAPHASRTIRTVRTIPSERLVRVPNRRPKREKLPRARPLRPGLRRSPCSGKKYRTPSHSPVSILPSIDEIPGIRRPCHVLQCHRRATRSTLRQIRIRIEGLKLRVSEKNRDCSIVTEDFLNFEGAIGRYFPERGFLEVWSWMAPEAMWPIPPKASGGSRIFPRRRLSDDPATIDDAPVPGADTERIGCGRPSGRCTIWATRCPDGRDSWRLPTRNITALLVDTISTPTCWIWPCPTPITHIG